MVAAAAARAGEAEQTLVVDLPFPGEAGAVPFTRADIAFTGVDHSRVSYEVRLFFNNPTATVDTPRVPEQGYAGRFVVFGHGGCFGGDGHCDPPAAPSTSSTDLRRPHPLTPQDTYVTVTKSLRRMLADGGALRTVTLVPVSAPPRQTDRKPAPELLKFDDVRLETYLSATESEAD